MNKICPFLVVREHCLKDFCVFWIDTTGACSLLVAIAKYLNEETKVALNVSGEPELERFNTLVNEFSKALKR